MAYVNCAMCPAQSYLYGHHQFEVGKVLEEYRCLSKHKTFIEREPYGNTRAETVEGSADRTSTCA